jgi:hypothetical protein
MSQRDIPKATLAAGDQSDPAWWLACAEWHEKVAANHRASADGDMTPLAGRAYFDLLAQQSSAAALACRTFAAMMERWNRYALRVDGVVRWHIVANGEAVPAVVHRDYGPHRSLPAAAVKALTDTQE